MVRSASVVLIASLLSSPAEARLWPDTGGWAIIQSDDSCGLMNTFEGKGESQLILGVTLSGDSFVQLTNMGWSAEKDAEYELDWSLNGSVYSGKAHGVGDKYESRKGFVGTFGPDLVADFEKASGLTVYRGKTVVDDLSLKGTAAAMAVVRRCLAVVRAEKAAAAAEKKRLSHIADDPFAEGGTATATPAAGSEPESSWISSDDYPPSSLRASEEGAVTVRYDVNTSGRIEGCEIAKSSGSSALDRGTCSALTRRGRFEPAASTRTRTFTYTWKLPPDVR